jgi:hypothetical protein
MTSASLPPFGTELNPAPRGTAGSFNAFGNGGLINPVTGKPWAF